MESEPMNFRVYYHPKSSTMEASVDFFATREEVAKEGAPQVLRHREKGALLRRIMRIDQNGQELGVVLSS